MMASLEKLKNVLSRHRETSQPSQEIFTVEKAQVTAKPEMRAVVPLFARPQVLGSVGEKLYFHFCEGCKVSPELLGVKGSLCLLGCEKVGCQKRLFRIETDTA